MMASRNATSLSQKKRSTPKQLRSGPATPKGGTLRSIAGIDSTAGAERVRGSRVMVRRSARLKSKLETHVKHLSAVSGDQCKAAPFNKHKRLHEIDGESNDPVVTRTKRRRTSTAPVKRPSNNGASSYISEPSRSRIDHWRREYNWPQESLEFDMDTNLARKKSTRSLNRKRSEPDALTVTTQNEDQREKKSAPYRNPLYEDLLMAQNSFMKKPPASATLTNTSKALIKTLLEGPQNPPTNTKFDDAIFEDTCERIRNKNEARVIRDISLLIVPSAEDFASRGAEHLECLIESVNEGWNNSRPIMGTRPQPDFSVGFALSAFTDLQRLKLKPYIGDVVQDDSIFMATGNMFLPCLTCEVKCGNASVEIADRQNAHSMTIALRGIVELFRLVGREKEINREVLAFSISHDNILVRVYGHYPVLSGAKISYYRHLIHRSDFAAFDGRDKWHTYKFVKNVYDLWMPKHVKRVRDLIDALPLGTQSNPGTSSRGTNKTGSPLEHSNQESGIAEGDVIVLDIHHSSNKPVKKRMTQQLID